MREMEQRAYSYLGKNPILCMDMLEVLRRGEGEVAAVSTDGVLVRVRRGGAFMLAADNVQAAGALSGGIESGAQLAVHDKNNARQLMDELGYSQIMECRAAAYIEPFPPSGGAFDLSQIHQLGPRDEESVLRSFPEEMEQAEVRERLQARALHGTVRDGELVGLVGLYPEGGIGPLAVRGDLGEEDAWELLTGLVVYMTGWCLDGCLAPYAHIPVENEGMLALYEQIGYMPAEKNMYWLA